MHVRRREAERRTARVAGDDDPVDLGRASEKRRRRTDVAGADELADPRRRDALDQRDRAHVEPERLEQREVTRAAVAEPEPGARGDELRADPREVGPGERLRRERRELLGERDDEDVLDAEVREQLEASLERREELDAVPEDDARVRVEGDDRRARTGLDGRPDNRPMPEVNAVERADCDRPRPPLELRRGARDRHAGSDGADGRSSARTPARTAGGTRSTASGGSLASASAAGTRRSRFASPTSNGPISVRRSARQ